MDQAESRRQRRAQLAEAQRDLAKLTAMRKRKQCEWAAGEENFKARISEINRQLSQLRRVVTFPEMFQKVAELRLGPDVYRALMAETTQRLTELDLATQVASAVDRAGPS